MRISRGVLAAALVAWAGLAHAEQPKAPPAPYASAQAALEHGLGAFRTARYETALSALTAAAARGDPSTRFIAEFYLARIYAADVGPVTDHTKAFVLYRKLADENLTVDPLTNRRAPFVAKALIALAGYARAGVKAIELAPNPRRATDYLHHAAVFFGDRDAQLELARVYLGTDGATEPSKDDVRRGLHYLAVLAEESHGPAQAMLAELFWRGRHVSKDDRRALALVTMAVANAPQHERIWIEEGYAAIFCAANQITRAEAGVLVARWRQTFWRPDGAVARTGSFELLPSRQCASGEAVALAPPGGTPKLARVPEVTAVDARAAAAAVGPGAPTRPVPVGPLKTAPAAAGFKAAGIVEAAAAKK